MKENKTISLVDHVIWIVAISRLNMPLSIEISWVEQCICIVFMYEMCLNLNLHTFEGIMEDINDFLSWSIWIFSPNKFYVMIFFLSNQILPYMRSQFYWFEDDSTSNPHSLWIRLDGDHNSWPCFGLEAFKVPIFKNEKWKINYFFWIFWLSKNWEVGYKGRIWKDTCEKRKE